MVRPLTGIPADKSRSYASIEAQATSVRELLGYRVDQRIDARRFFEYELGDMRLQIGTREISIVGGVEECASEGMTRWDADKRRLELVLSVDTYSRLSQDHVRARYTVFHEFGHLAQHAEQIMRLAGLSLTSQVAFHRQKSVHSPCQDTEWQANAFAGALLMPALGVDALVREYGSYLAFRIAQHFGTSEEAAQYRSLTYKRGL